MSRPFANDLDRLNEYAEVNKIESVDQVTATWRETFNAGLDMSLAEERIDSQFRAWRPHIDARIDAIATLGGDRQLAELYAAEQFTGKLEPMRQIIKSAGPDAARRQELAPGLVDAILQQEAFERAAPDQVKPDALISAEIAAELATRRQQNESTLSRGSGLAGFAGSAVGLVSDPIVAMSLPFGPGPQVGRGIAVNAGRGFLGETAVAGAIEVPIQLQVARFKAEINSPWSFEQGAYNVLAASLGAGAIRATGSIGIDVTRQTLAKYRKLPSSKITDETEAAAEILERVIEAEENNPLTFREAGEPGENVPNNPANQEALTKARAQLEAGARVDVADTVAGSEPLHVLDQAAARVLPENIVVVGPDELLVDPVRFQFKAGGDVAGVTDSLRGVDRFDPSLAGQVLVWQDRAGARYIVDGHQRLGLAKRALAAGQDPAEVKLTGFVLKEADGVSELAAMRVGALRNLTAATGSALDAAKVLRGIGPAGETLLPPLPPNSALLRQGRFIARLSDEAFNAVVNGVIPERQAALVGELLSDPKQQLAAMGTLAKLKPANELQARAMVEQMRAAGFRIEKTGDLFGEREVAESLIRERAQVLDAAVKAARQDKQTFSTLVSRGTDIEGTGANRLDAEANQQKVTESAQAIEIITRLANQKGEISDALNEAARAVAEGAKPADVADTVFEAVRRGSTGGDTPGQPAARDGSDLDDAFDVEPSTRLTPEQQEIEQRFTELLNATPWEDLKAQYAALPEAGGGKILSVDAARELSPDYLADRANAAAVHEPASAFIKRLYAERLAEAPPAGTHPLVTFTAGGTGAGKTTGLKISKATENAQIVMDSNLAKLGSAARKIDQALAAGKRVIVNYVYRDPIEALVNGALPRATRQELEHGTGRTVPIEVHVATHVDSNTVVRELAEKYADEPNFRLFVVDNSNGKGKAMVSSVDKLPELDHNTVDGLARQALEDARANGEISENTYQGFAGPGRSGQEAGPGDGGLDQSNRAGAGSEPETEGAGQKVAATAAADKTTLSPTPARGLPDEGSETGYIADSEYRATIEQFEALDADTEGLAELARVTLDENGQPVVDVITARRVMDDLENQETALRDIEVCSTRAAA